MTKHLRLSIACVTSLVLAQTSWGWGPTGHRTVGTVAESFLSSSTKQVLNQYLNGQSLADASTWADEIKSKPQVWDQTFPYHFESVSDGQTYLQSLHGLTPDEVNKGGLVAALLEAQRMFRSPSTKPSDKAIALKFIIHFVGDIHQPLHSGRPEDRGGNLILRKWHNQSTNLHAIWDVLIIDEAYATQLRSNSHKPSKPSPPKVDNEVYAADLLKKYQGQHVPGDVDDIGGWLAESIDLRAAAYEYKDESEQDYTARFIDTVDQRLYYGGVRLAALLTSLASGEAASQMELGFRAAIESILGPLNHIINLNPSGVTRVRTVLGPNIETESSNPSVLVEGVNGIGS
jgi:hypothetical protein